MVGKPREATCETCNSLRKLQLLLMYASLPRPCQTLFLSGAFFNIYAASYLIRSWYLFFNAESADQNILIEFGTPLVLYQQDTSTGILVQKSGTYPTVVILQVT